MTSLPAVVLTLKQTSTFSKLLCLCLLLLIPEQAIPQNGEPVAAKNGMVVSADPLATKIGLQVLRRGGNAIDAAVAVGFALAVTYPVAGNIGGGGYFVIHLRGGADIAVDFREMAPAAAFKDMYLDSSGAFLPEKSQYGASAAGVPGSVAGFTYILAKYGTMQLKDILTPVIALADDGFPLSSPTARSLESAIKDFSRFPSTLKIFTNNGKPWKEGDILRQKDLAATLRDIAAYGRDGFYKGRVASLIARQMQQDNGYVTAADLEAYKVIEKPALKGTYRGYGIVSMPPSSSGGTTLLELLNILEQHTFTRDEWGSSSYYHKLADAMKYAYADRSEHLGDPDFYPVPVDWLTSKEYAASIFARHTGKAVPSAQIAPGKQPRKESEQTTHYSVIDREGNAVSVTTTINSGYGSCLVVEGAGFLLNNEMDDFSAKPGVPNQFGLTGGEANAIQPGKRMLSSMTPTIVTKDGKPFIVVGTPGGSTIITVVLQVVLNTLEFGMNIRKAVEAPRIHHQWLPDEIMYEPLALNADTREKLTALGYKIGTQRRLGLVEAIMVDAAAGKYYGWSDSRGFGLAEGY